MAAGARLEPLVDGFASTRAALHRVAAELVAPARKPHNEIALRATPGGFGTPVFEFGGVECQVRVEGGELVVRRGDGESREPLTTLSAGAEQIGADLLPDGPPTDEASLEVDPEAARQLATWYAWGDEVLSALRAGLEGSPEDPSEINLWPEHFDLAFEAGSEKAGRRAGYGASPGDDVHEAPYIYVAPWTAKMSGPLWAASGFNGAEMRYGELVGAVDPGAKALEFFRVRKEAIDAT